VGCGGHIAPGRSRGIGEFRRSTALALAPARPGCFGFPSAPLRFFPKLFFILSCSCNCFLSNSPAFFFLSGFVWASDGRTSSSLVVLVVTTNRDLLLAFGSDPFLSSVGLEPITWSPFWWWQQRECTHRRGLEEIRSHSRRFGGVIFAPNYGVRLQACFPDFLNKNSRLVLRVRS